MGWSPGFKSIHPGPTFEAPIGLIKKTRTNKAKAKAKTDDEEDFHEKDFHEVPKRLRPIPALALNHA